MTLNDAIDRLQNLRNHPDTRNGEAELHISIGGTHFDLVYFRVHLGSETIPTCVEGFTTFDPETRVTADILRR